MYPKQHLKSAKVTAKNRLQNKVIKTIRNYARRLVACYKGDNLLNKRTEIFGTNVDTETNANLKIATQKIDAIHQSHNVIKGTITLT